MSCFWDQVNRAGIDECWPWTGKTIKGGYGDFRLDGRHIIAHRHAWALTNGPIPGGLFVLHRCDNPPCCNPGHLFLGTHQDNMDDMRRKGRGPDTGGARNGNATLTAQDVNEIRRLVNEEHESRTEVGRKFGIDRRTAGDIASGALWRHLPLVSLAWAGSTRGRRRTQRDPAAPIRCSRCHEAKPPSEFPPSAAKRGNGYCRACMREWGVSRRRYV